MSEIHCFDVAVAKMYGVNCAIILQNIWHWVRKNEANETNFYDGHYWTYNSTKAFQELLPYLSKKQIETALKRLRDDGIIITGNYNQLKYDRTLWYAVTEKGKSILLTGEIKITSGENENHREVTPIPDINTDINTDINIYSRVVEYLNEKAGTRYKSANKKTQSCIHARLAEGFELDDFKTVIDKKCADWIGTEWERFLRPETLFGTKFESYLNAKSFARKKPVNTGVPAGDAQDDLDDLF